MSQYGAADPGIGRAFLENYAAHNWRGLAEMLDDDVTWELPGAGRISGRIIGKDAVVHRVRLIVGGGTKTELLHTLIGQAGIALILHNTGTRADGVLLDEFLTTLLRVDETGTIVAIETYLSDVHMMETFFQDVDPVE